ncbi:MAG: DUF2461 domain-containing protein [Bacteroidales bacterium]|nr:DUF2461 domain-containing protein [Bacteroidales bacterium]
MEKIIFDFLNELKTNNNREWFQSNKSRYEKAKKSFESFIDELIPVIRGIDPNIDLITAKDCVFRIYRDVRFSHDKSPYKTNMGAYITRGGKSSPMAGYYVHCEPGGSFLAGGIYMPQPDVLKKIRDEVFYKYDEFRKIIEDKEFVKTFGQIDDDQKMKSPPRGYPKEFPGIALLKFRNYAVAHFVSDELALSEKYPEYAKKVFKTLYPLNSFFNNVF